jgi:hypothetical protein
MKQLDIKVQVDSEDEIKELLGKLATLKEKYEINLTIYLFFGKHKDLSYLEPRQEDMRS